MGSYRLVPLRLKEKGPCPSKRNAAKDGMANDADID